MTGDLTCIPDKGLRSLFKKGPKYSLSLRKGLNTDFHPGLILLSAGILSKMHFRHIVNVGPKRKALECMPLTTGKMNFYALLTFE